MEINKIYNENCLETMARMPDNFVDLTVTSPPYNINGTNRYNNFKLNYDVYNDNLPIDKYFDFINDIIIELLRVTKYHIFFNIAELSGNKGILKNILTKFNNNIKDIFIWAKNNPMPFVTNGTIQSSFEYIICISKDFPKQKKFTYHNFKNRLVTNCLIHSVNSGKENDVHSFAFPMWLPEYFINHFSKEEDLIYDPFMGSGTTAKMALLLKRNFIGSEISKKYCEIAEKRIKQNTGFFELEFLNKNTEKQDKFF